MLHYLEDCRGTLSDRDTRTQVYLVLGSIELRMTQRALLRFAGKAGFFAVASKPDAISLHSLRRLGLMSTSGRPGVVLRERYWHITRLGELVLAAQEDRQEEIEKRERTRGRGRLAERQARAAA